MLALPSFICTWVEKTARLFPCWAVTKNSICWVNVFSRQGIQQQESSFGSLSSVYMFSICDLFWENVR